MKESDKNIKKLIGDIFAESNLESPSIDFTSKVMSQILVVEKIKIQHYTPLISKTIWIVIIGSLISLILYFAFWNESNNSEIGYSYVVNISNIFSEFHFSINTIYAILIVPLMILVQIPLLKNYYDKKYQL
ncbi:hypothetical protein BC952_0631 [Flavobacterium limicola]|uniref:Uncharacterized protein n=1 Tax=Flavobacterium limicola TaxID=180441 RepID=A0A495S586_9FLAO|nr:hypothetical protein [Flavobacterium limicola]RKS94993.1 hypothetical protein BC952_0631 [Flavobacterium limicola]